MSTSTKPFIKLLQSPYGFYFFDVNRNQIVAIPEKIYWELSEVLEGKKTLDNQNTAIQKLKALGFLSDKRVKKIEHPDTKLADDVLENGLFAITLQVTQGCNFRCSYCIYSDLHNEKQRSHSAKRMNWETAKKAVDFLAKRSSDSEMISVGFYGGEPLLEFELIKKVVAYAENVFKGKNLFFPITTNGSLLTEEIIDFMHDHNFNLLLSMDGPESIHNINRRFASNGKGSFQTIVRNIQILQNKYPDWAKNMGISMVMDPQNDYDEISSICDKHSPFKDCALNATTIDDEYSIQRTIFSEDYVSRSEYQRFLGFLSIILEEKAEVSKIAIDQVRMTLQDMDSMKPMQQLPDCGAPGGPCLPGRDRLFANVDGNLYPCERVSEDSPMMRIGNLDDGFDMEQVKRLVNVAQFTAEECKECWAFVHCSQCPKSIDNNGHISKEYKLNSCRNTRLTAENNFKDAIMMKECEHFIRERKLAK